MEEQLYTEGHGVTLDRWSSQDCPLLPRVNVCMLT